MIYDEHVGVLVGMHLIGTLTAIPDLEVKGSYIYNTTDVIEVRNKLIYFRERDFHRIILLASATCTEVILRQVSRRK